MKLLITLLLTTLTIVANSQNHKLKELDKKNGFKSIKFGDNVNNYDYLIRHKTSSKAYNLIIRGKKNNFSEDKTHVADLKMNKELAKIGDIDVRAIYVGTFNNLINDIVVVTDNELDMYKALVQLYGEPNRLINSGTSNLVASWDADNVYLSMNAADSSCDDEEGNYIYRCQHETFIMRFFDKKITSAYRRDKEERKNMKVERKFERIRNSF